MYKVGDIVHIRGFTYVGPILDVNGKKFLVDCVTCRMWVEASTLEFASEQKTAMFTFPVKVKVPSKGV